MRLIRVCLFVLLAVEVLLAFYENRLKDHYVIIPHVLQGLKALVSLSTFVSECARSAIGTVPLIFTCFYCCLWFLSDEMLGSASWFSGVRFEIHLPGYSCSGGYVYLARMH